MADPSNSFLTTPTHPTFQTQCSTISKGEEKTARAFLRSAGAFNVEQAFSSQQADNGKQMGSSLTERSSIKTQEHPKTTKEALSPAQKLAGRLREYYIDVKTLDIFEYYFFEQLPEALKSIYMDCKNDLLKFINIDCTENPSQEEEALLSTCLPLRLTEILNEIIRQSTIIKLEETEWLAPLLLLLDEFKILLPNSENRKFIRPMYQFACTVHDNDRLPVDRRLSILMFMQENGEVLDFTANEYRLFESLIKSLLDSHQPAPEAEPETPLEATHTDEPPSTGSLTPVQEDAPTDPDSSGITQCLSKLEQQRTEATVSTPVASDSLTIAAAPEVAEESFLKPEPKQDSSAPRKKDRKKKQKPPEDEIDAALREIRESDITKAAAKKRASKALPDSALSDKERRKKKPQTHQSEVGVTVSKLPAVVPTPSVSNPPLEELSRYSIMLGLRWVDKAMGKLTSENINAPIPRKEITPLLDIFNHTVRLEEHHVNSMIEKDCDFNATCPCTINGKRVNTSVGLYAVHKLADLSSSKLSPQEHEAQKDAIYRNLSLLIKAGVDINMPAEFLTEDIFNGLTTEPVMIYTPVQLATVKKQHEMIKFLLEHEANPNKPLRPGNLECYPIHVACMKVSPPGSIETLSALFSPGKFHTNPNQLTNDSSTPVHYLAEAAIMRMKKLETTYSTYTEERISSIQKSHITFMELNELGQMTTILREHGTDFDQTNSHCQRALEFFRTRVKEAVLAPEVKENMKRLDVFFTSQEPEQPVVRQIPTQAGRVNKAKWHFIEPDLD